MRILTFDIGGTNIKYALCDENFNLSDKHSVPTDAKQGGQYIINKVIGIIEQYENIDRVAGVAGKAEARSYGLSPKISLVGKYPVNNELDGVLVYVGSVALYLVDQNVPGHPFGPGPRCFFGGSEKPVIYQGVRKGYNGNSGNVGAVFSLAYVPDIGQHPLVILHDLALIHSQYLFNEGRSRPATVQHGLLVHA